MANTLVHNACRHCHHARVCSMTRYIWDKRSRRHGINTTGCTPDWTLVGRVIHWLDARWH
jgi:hypothetical protein